MNLDNLNNPYVFAIIIFFCPLIGRIVKSLIEFHNLSKEYSSSTSLTNSLIRLTQKEFQIWCSEYLSYLGYTDIILSPILSDKVLFLSIIMVAVDVAEWLSVKNGLKPFSPMATRSLLQRILVSAIM